MNQLQTVRDALEHGKNTSGITGQYDEALAIIKSMMQAEPVCVVPQYELDYMNESASTGAIYKVGSQSADDNEADIPLYAAPVSPQAVPAEPDGKTCSNCTFHYKDVDMKPCSNCERGCNIEDNWMPKSAGQIALAAAPAVKERK